MKSYRIYKIATIFLILGLTVTVAGFAMVNFDYKQLSTEPPFYEKNYISKSEVKELTIDDFIDTNITTSSDDRIHVTYFENEKYYYNISESTEGVMSITKENSLKWTDYILNIAFDTPILNIELPKNFNGDITVKNNYGNLVIDTINAKNLTLNAENQNLLVKNSKLAGEMEVNTRDGNINIEKTSVTGNIDVENIDGNILLSEISAKKYLIINENGMVALNSIDAAEEISAKTSNGNITLTKTSFGTNLDCETNYGNITGDIIGESSDFSYDCEAYNGECNLPEKFNGGKKNIRIKTINGSINMYLKN